MVCVHLDPAERCKPDLRVWEETRVCWDNVEASQGFVCDGMKVQKE